MTQDLSWLWRHELRADEALPADAVRLWRGGRPAGKLARGWAVAAPPRDVALGDRDVFEGVGVGLSGWMDVIEPLWMWVVPPAGARLVHHAGVHADPSGGGGWWMYAGGTGASLDLALEATTVAVRWGASFVVGVSARAEDPVDVVESALRLAVDDVVRAWLEGASDAVPAAVRALAGVRVEADATWRAAEGLERARLGARLLAADAALARLAPWILPCLPDDGADGALVQGRGWWTGDGFPAFGPVGGARS